MIWLYVGLFFVGGAVGWFSRKVWQILHSTTDGVLHLVYFEKEDQLDMLVEFEEAPSKFKTGDRVIFDVRASRR